MKRYHYILLLVSFLSIFYLSSCFDESFRETPDTFLEFSRDTLSFDTVFTTLGSATRRIKVYNPYEESVSIDKIYLDNQAQDRFRLNIDGLQANQNENIEIGPLDSIYIFAEVTINPDDPLSASPFILEDYIRFSTNGNEQEVLLLAWGQNANYIPNSNNKGGQALLSCDFGSFSFDDEKPYVVYGVLLVDSCELVLPAGTDLYVHGGVVVTEEGGAYNDGLIVVLENGKITSQGTVDNPVTIQGDRLEPEYDDVPGQWGGIIINNLSKGSKLENTVIKNSVIGIRVDSLAEIELSKCQFYNQTSSGLVGFHAGRVYAENCLFYNAGGSTVSLAYGGDFTLNYCTMASFESAGAALAISNFRCLDPTCLSGFLFNPVKLNMNNCIMIGDDIDELILADRSDEVEFDYTLNNCVVQVNELLDVVDFANFFDNCNGCLNVTPMDTIFNNPMDRDFRLDTMSVALDKGFPLNNIDDDILGVMRNPSTPDPGCFEFE